ncbi:MAG: folate family ECF transporter S component [Clostridiales bacterium]|nr:folate family ECF transporter S component [Clostridiales bacterium]
MYNRISSIRKIAYTGLFIAISIILTRFFSGNITIAGIYALRLTFGEIPIILNGLLLGPVFGAACGILSDIIGYAINPLGGAYFPGFTLTAMLTGLIPGVLSKYFLKELKWHSIAIIIVLTELMAVPLNTLWLSLLHGKAYITLLVPRIIGKGILIPVYIIIITMTAKHIRHIFSFTRR